MRSIGFIGCGNMGGALARAAARTLSAQVCVFDPTAEKTQAISREVGATPLSAEQIAEEAEFVVLGVKPQNLEAVLGGLRAPLQRNASAVLVSMAAGVSIEAVKRFAGGNYPVIRIMPNTPCMLGKGTVLYAVDGVSAEQEERFLHYLSAAGKFFKMPEESIDGAGALSGCGPAYYYLFADGLAKGAEALGIDRETAVLLAAQTMVGAGEMLLAYGDPVDLRNRVCSPGGTTLEGVAALQKGNVEGVAASAVEAAYRRTLELKQ